LVLDAYEVDNAGGGGCVEALEMWYSNRRWDDALGVSEGGKFAEADDVDFDLVGYMWEGGDVADVAEGVVDDGADKVADVVIAVGTKDAAKG